MAVSTRNLTGIHGDHNHKALIFQDKTVLISHLSAVFSQYLNRPYSQKAGYRQDVGDF
jgi:hypothetical protein